ncbi:DUF2569 domain-containing protein [Oceanirhabdus seepicola]|uniref:DUF2569 domain-containing protein n=1 Tax=Oceanirhabdus seepicola TaxID=2828781 RepID=A0A9J6P3N1_9CLOT|nr:DUF2569 domain-containing protein [Oceanirhabdus seepicola]MCM1991147.1 DUF2569 domain-containing protein [Oceanirhabdus seepicola]
MDENQKHYLEDENNIDEDKDLKGLGGWLILIGFGLIFTILTAGNQLIKLYSLFSKPIWTEITNKALDTYQALLAPLIIFETIANTILLLLVCILIINYFTKKKLFPKLMISMYSYNLVIAIIDFIFVLNLASVTSADITSSVMTLIKVLLVSCIWIPYFIKSKRVKNTFIN